MTEFTLATFNVKNLIGADQEYYRFEKYTPEEYAWKKDWLADQIVTLDADVIAFQEIFDEEALWDVIAEANRRGEALNDAVIPDRTKPYRKKAIFRKLGYRPYDRSGLRFAPNVSDGEPGHRRPGLAILSRNGFAGEQEVIQSLSEETAIAFRHLTGGPAGEYATDRISRPIQIARVPVGGAEITLFNIHLKSKLGEYLTPPGAPFSAEADLVNYDGVGRASGEFRASVRRMAEALHLRHRIIASLDAGEPVIVTGDFNDSEHSVVSAMIAGETPFKNYAWMRRHDAETSRDRYTEEEDELIRGQIERLKLTSAEKLFIRKSARDMVYTSAFGGVYESIDQILLSRHFHPDNEDRVGELEYLSVLNDHITDGSHPEAPYNKLASDHGQLLAHLRMYR